MNTNEPKPDESDAEQVAAKIADRRDAAEDAAKPSDGAKPDEGRRLDQLSTETDGGSQG